jgi:hypothetical protein
MKAVFWDVALYIYIYCVNRHFGGTYRLNFIETAPKGKEKELRAQINGKFNDIHSADEDK